MTEAEWLGWSDATYMLEHLRRKASDRKLRLFACACCGPLSHLLSDPRSCDTIRIAERYADGQATQEELKAAYAAAPSTNRWRPKLAARDQAASAAKLTAHLDAWQSARSVAGAANFALRCDPGPSQRTYFSIELRCIMGNPFRSVPHPVPHLLTWNGSTIPKLAQGTYDDRAFDRLPALADALEEAGCTNADMLSHCRGPGPHVRGCWVIDLLLAKE